MTKIPPTAELGRSHAVSTDEGRPSIRHRGGAYVTHDPRAALEFIRRECADSLWATSGTILRVSTQKARPPHVLIQDLAGRTRIHLCPTIRDVRDLVEFELRPLGANPDVEFDIPETTSTTVLTAPAGPTSPSAPAARKEREKP